MPVDIRPLCGKVLLQVHAREAEENLGGIVVRGRAVREGFRRAVVRRLPDRYSGALEVGQSVLIPPYTGSEVILNGETLVFMREEKVEAVLEE
jgi:co-chaperonin GroES (HSP10)